MFFDQPVLETEHIHNIEIEPVPVRRHAEPRATCVGSGSAGVHPNEIALGNDLFCGIGKIGYGAEDRFEKFYESGLPLGTIGIVLDVIVPQESGNSTQVVLINHLVAKCLDQVFVFLRVIHNETSGSGQFILDTEWPYAAKRIAFLCREWFKLGDKMAHSFEGRVALVTGGASGMGRAAAQLFAREKASVIISTDSNIKGGEETVRLIREAGGEATFVRCDVTKAREVEAMVDKAVQLYGGLHYAFNNAGIGPDGGRWPIVAVADCPEEIWDRTIDINLKGVFLCMKYELRQMLKQHYGAIVNNSSLGALKSVPGFAAYDASKTGMIGLTKAAALEYAAQGIRINVMLPGPTDRTGLMENLSRCHPEEREKINGEIPMKRLAQPEEMAELVLWLCSDASSFVTGSAISIDGGMCAK